MSAPNNLLRQASSVRYGVLSVKASKALRTALEHRQLTDDQKQALKRAADFLVEISEGARLANGTFPRHARPSRSIAALDFALGPIDSLRNEINEDIAPYFDKMAHALSNTANNRLPQNQLVAARHALSFFETLHWSLLRDRQAKRIVLGGPRRKVA